MQKAKEKNPKDALGGMKVPIGLYPNVARIETCLVFAQSAAEYGEYNWRNNLVRLSIYLDAIDRHVIALRAGQDIDPQSRRPHVAHINACTAIIMEAQRLGILVDDRFEKDPSAYLLDSLTPDTYRLARGSLGPQPARTLEQLRACRGIHSTTRFLNPGVWIGTVIATVRIAVRRCWKKRGAVR